jgi:hypothetical protein
LAFSLPRAFFPECSPVKQDLIDLLENRGLRSDSLDVHELKEDLLRLEGDAAELRPSIRQGVKEYRNALEEQYRLIFNCEPVENVESI